MRFRGRIDDAFPLKGKDGLVLTLNHIEGMPERGMVLSLAGRRVCIVDVGTNSTDGQAVSTRSCLTGESVPAYGSVFVDWALPYPERAELHQEWVEEVSKT